MYIYAQIMAKKQTYILDLKTGKMVPKQGKSVELLREDLRQLPSALVTKDRADPDKIHELDPKHIQHDLIRDHVAGPKKKPEVEHDMRPRPLTQELVDYIRARVWRVTVEKAKTRLRAHKTVDLTVGHLWFPEDNHLVYEYRKGNPPGPGQRPKHMKHLRLEIDPTALCPLPEKLRKKALKAARKQGGDFRTLPPGTRNFSAEMYEVVAPEPSPIIKPGEF